MAFYHGSGPRVVDGLEEIVSLRSWTGPGPGLEVAVMGRLSADMYPTEIRTPLREQQSFVRYVGGFAGNVCTGLARLEVGTSIVSKVGQDGHGEFIRDFLAREGVDVRWLGRDGTLNTPVVFCEIWPPDRFPLLFYRTPTCPDWELTTDDFDLEAVAEAPVLLASGTGLARVKSRAAHMAALERHRHIAILDLDYRPSFWPNPSTYKDAIEAALSRADIVVGNEDEVRAATGLQDARKGVEALSSFGKRVVILKRGGEGAALFDGSRVIEVPPVRMEVVNGLGAGDAFLAAVTHAVLRGIDLETAVRRANWAGAFVASQIPCSEAMPYLRDLDTAVPAA
jgi:5-dehydro-2-deoxygluconokinase